MPGHHINQEKRAVYNICVTVIVDNTLQMTGFGGSKNAGEIHDRMLGESPADQERDTVEAPSGLSKNANT